MRVAVVAGPDPGHAFPALALCRRFLAAGDTPTLLTGTEWLNAARGVGVDAVELEGLDPTAADDDTDAGAKIHQRAARMAVQILLIQGGGSGVHDHWHSSACLTRPNRAIPNGLRDGAILVLCPTATDGVESPGIGASTAPR